MIVFERFKKRRHQLLLHGVNDAEKHFQNFNGLSSNSNELYCEQEDKASFYTTCTMIVIFYLLYHILPSVEMCPHSDTQITMLQIFMTILH